MRRSCIFHDVLRHEIRLREECMKKKNVKPTVASGARKGTKAVRRQVRGTTVKAQVQATFMRMVTEAVENKGRISPETLEQAIGLEKQIPRKQVVGVSAKERLRIIEERLSEIFNDVSKADEQEVRRLLNRKARLQQGEPDRRK